MLLDIEVQKWKSNSHC